MKQCTTCGGELLLLNQQTYRCMYCENEYSASGESGKPMAPSVAKQADHGVDVFDRNINSVLEITWRDQTHLHSGSGFLVTRDGYAITNTHVVTREDGSSVGTVNVRLCGQTTTARVVRLGDDRHGHGSGVDLALIRLEQIPPQAKPIKFARAEEIRNGERVFVIGNSLGYGTCITSGIVSDRRRVVDGDTLLMTDCAVNGGNSGGPIFNDQGFVIGAIVSGITSAEGMNFAIPVDIVQAFLQRNSVSTNEIRQNASTTQFGAFTGLTGSSGQRCIYCGLSTAKYVEAYKKYICTNQNCGASFSKEQIDRWDGTTGRRKSSAPCPKCGSTDTYVDGRGFTCDRCGYVNFS